MEKELEKEHKYGLMGQNIKDNGLMIKHMVKEYYIIQMVIDIKDN